MNTNNETICLSGPDQVAYARLAVIKGRLKLESKGLKFRGASTRGQLAVEFGLKPRDGYDKYIAYCEKKMAEALAKRQAEMAKVE